MLVSGAHSTDTMTRTIIPMAFWASLAPWLKAKSPEVRYCDIISGRLIFRLALRSRVLVNLMTKYPPMNPMPTERKRKITTLVIPTNWPPDRSSFNPQLTFPNPAAAMPDPISPPTRACVDEEGMPHTQVTRFQATAPTRVAKMT